MRVLLIHQAFTGPADPGGTRHYELARHLVAKGNRVTVITSRENYLTGEAKTKTQETGIDVCFTPTLSGLHRSYLWRSVVFASFMLSSVFTGLSMGRPDVVMGTSPPIFQAVSAWVVAAIRGRPLVLEIRDLWPGFAVELGVLRNRVLIDLGRSIERFLYRRADQIIVNSPAYREYLLDRGVQDSKISIISNGVETTMFEPQSRGEAFRHEHALEAKFVVMYAGALGIANNVELLLRAAARMRQEPEIAFVLVGGGKELPALKSKVEQMRLENIYFIPAQAKERMPEVLAAADTCVATLKDIPLFRMPYPNKVFDYMAAGRPTILAIDGAIRGVIESSKGGVFVSPGDDRALAEAILKLRNSPDLRKQMGANARTYVVQHFEREVQARKLKEVLEVMAGNK